MTPLVIPGGVPLLVVLGLLWAASHAFIIWRRRQAERALVEAQRQLAERVAERTESLSRANEALARQVAARERLEHELRDQKADLALTLRSLAEGVLVTDAAGHVTLANPAAERLLGRPEEEIVGQPLDAVLHLVEASTDRPLDAAVAGIASGAPGTVLPPTAIVIARSGVRTPVELHGTPTHDPPGEPRGAVVVLRDIAERLRTESQLRLSDRLIALGTLAAGIGHEINNPLQFVCVNLDESERVAGGLAADLRSTAAKSSSPGEPKTTLARVEVVSTEKSGRIRDAAARAEQLATLARESREGTERLRRIVRDLRLFARSDDEPAAPLDLRRVVETALGVTQNQIRHRAALSVELDEVPPIIAHEGRLGQVAVNLLLNAAQAIPDGHADRHAVRVTAGTTPAGDAFFEVRDTGVGIPAAHLPRLFDPFFTTRPVGVGSGLGLSICHGVVHQLGGRIHVESEPGKGAAFRVEIPAAPPGTALPESEPPIPPPPARRARLLIVDDERLICASLARVLGRDFEVTAHTSAEEALARLREGDRYDLILCDVMMPGMSGMELYEAVRAEDAAQATRMAFMTGGAFTAEAREFLRRVDNAQLDKPVNPATVRRLVAERVAGEA